MSECSKRWGEGRRMKYLYPCKPNSLAPSSKYFDVLDNDTDWIAEVKKNGWRCLTAKDCDVKLYTRHQTLFRDALTPIREALENLPDQTILDGELIFTKRVKDAPDGLYLFDIITLQGKLLTDMPLYRRRTILESIFGEYLSGVPEITLARQTRIGKKSLYHQSIGDAVNEGIVLKHINSKYIISEADCKQNPMWLKVKKTEEHLKVG